MSNLQPVPEPSAPPVVPNAPTALRCFMGAAIASVFALGLYAMTRTIAVTFAHHPLHTTNITAQNISVAVRTLVVGIGTLGTGIFGLTAMGLLGLGGQTFIRQITAKADQPL